MVKKACSLETLRDLGLSKRSLGHIEKKRFVEDLSLEDVDRICDLILQCKSI